MTAVVTSGVDCEVVVGMFGVEVEGMEGLSVLELLTEFLRIVPKRYPQAISASSAAAMMSFRSSVEADA